DGELFRLRLRTAVAHRHGPVTPRAYLWARAGRRVHRRNSDPLRHGRFPRTLPAPLAGRIGRAHVLFPAYNERAGSHRGGCAAVAVTAAGARRLRTLSIIVPVLDEADLIAEALATLAPLRARGAEVIVVDGGSRDRTMELARPHADQVIAAPRGRATQMNAGAAGARGDVLLFLHADTRLPADADQLMLAGLERADRACGPL